jgi:hypothetical protein
MYKSIDNFTCSKKIHTFGDQKGENKPSEPKNGIRGPKSIWSCGKSIVREFYIDQEKTYYWGSKRRKKAIRAQKRESGAQNQYDRVIYPSIGNFTCSKKKYSFGGQKGENKPSEPKNGIRGPKSIWS